MVHCLRQPRQVKAVDSCKERSVEILPDAYLPWVLLQAVVSVVVAATVGVLCLGIWPHHQLVGGLEQNCQSLTGSIW